MIMTTSIVVFILTLRYVPLTSLLYIVTQNPKPAGLELVTSGHLLDQYRDPDGDEARAKEIPKQKREKYKQMKM